MERIVSAGMLVVAVLVLALGGCTGGGDDDKAAGPDDDVLPGVDPSDTADFAETQIADGETEIADGETEMTDGEEEEVFWAPIPGSESPVVKARVNHSAVWTGEEMIIWGGADGSFLTNGARWNPTTGVWKAISDFNEPQGRIGHALIWSGTELLVWGGDGSPGDLGDGGAYNPKTDTWTDIEWGGAPQARSQHASVWTGHEMLIWGGVVCPPYPCQRLDSGGFYDPVRRVWRPMAPAPEPRSDVAYVWTGSHFIVLGGMSNSGSQSTGFRYDPDFDQWSWISNTGAPAAYFGSENAVWTGAEMIVWGGTVIVDGTHVLVNLGGRYNPSTDTWATISSAPFEPVDLRDLSTKLVWTGKDLIVWLDVARKGGHYDPSTDHWTTMSTIKAPSDRDRSTAIWTGSEMVIWGGGRYGVLAGEISSTDATLKLGNGGRYGPPTD